MDRDGIVSVPFPLAPIFVQAKPDNAVHVPDQKPMLAFGNPVIATFTSVPEAVKVYQVSKAGEAIFPPLVHAVSET